MCIFCASTSFGMNYCLFSKCNNTQLHGLDPYITFYLWCMFLGAHTHCNAMKLSIEMVIPLRWLKRTILHRSVQLLYLLNWTEHILLHIQIQKDWIQYLQSITQVTSFLLISKTYFFYQYKWNTRSCIIIYSTLIKHIKPETFTAA